MIDKNFSDIDENWDIIFDNFEKVIQFRNWEKLFNDTYTLDSINISNWIKLNHNMAK